MQDLSVTGDGLLYLSKCIGLYNGSSLFMLLYLLVLIFIVVKGGDEWKRIFLFPSIVLLFTVYNPVFPIFINRIFDINKEYYRFLWITPVYALLPAAATVYITRDEKSRGRMIVSFAGVLLILMGLGSFTYAKGYIPKQNVYKIPDEVMSVSKMIRKNTDMKYPVAIMDRDMQMEIRQYDASILLACNRTQYLDFLGDAFEDELTAEKNEYVNRLLSVVAKHEEIDKDSFREALDKTNTQFVVVEKNSPVIRYLVDTGLDSVGTTGGRIIFKYDLKEPVYLDFADYSAIWEEQF